MNAKKTRVALKHIASKYNQESDEHQSIKTAAMAILFIQMEGRSKEFIDFLESNNRKLSDEERAFIEKMSPKYLKPVEGIHRRHRE